LEHGFYYKKGESIMSRYCIVCLSILLYSAAAMAQHDVSVGDFNDNGKLDSDDIDALSAVVRAGTNDPAFNLNGDGLVDSEDRRVWVEEISETYFGDASLNGVFNTGDLVHVFKAGEYEDSVVDNSGWEEGDWDGDADFSTSDLVLAFSTGAFEGKPRLTHDKPNGVPEPSGCVILTLSCLGLMTMHRSVRKRQLYDESSESGTHSHRPADRDGPSGRHSDSRGYGPK
jgi:hypothetical protein